MGMFEPGVIFRFHGVSLCSLVIDRLICFCPGFTTPLTQSWNVTTRDTRIPVACAIGEWFQEGDSFLVIGKELTPARCSSDGTGIKPVSFAVFRIPGNPKKTERSGGGPLLNHVFYAVRAGSGGKRKCICTARITSKSLLGKIL
jgi:hypothetical protein